MFSIKILQHLYSVSCLSGHLSDGTNYDKTCSNQYPMALQPHNHQSGAIGHLFTNLGDPVLQNEELAREELQPVPQIWKEKLKSVKTL